MEFIKNAFGVWQLDYSYSSTELALIDCKLDDSCLKKSCFSVNNLQVLSLATDPSYGVRQGVFIYWFTVKRTTKGRPGLVLGWQPGASSLSSMWVHRPKDLDQKWSNQDWSCCL